MPRPTRLQSMAIAGLTMIASMAAVVILTVHPHHSATGFFPSRLTISASLGLKQQTTDPSGPGGRKLRISVPPGFPEVGTGESPGQGQLCAISCTAAILGTEYLTAQRMETSSDKEQPSAAAYQAYAHKPATSNPLYQLFWIIPTCLISVLAGYAIARTSWRRRQTGSLSSIMNTVKSLAQGDLTKRCTEDKKSPFGDLANSINIMAENMQNNNLSLTQFAMIDSLTELPNRTSLYLSMSSLFRKSHNQAILLFDLDFFKAINDTYGHDYGDRALKAVANILKRVKSNACFPGRLGGDEFLIFLSDYEDAEEPVRLAQYIQESIHKISHLGDIPVHLSASIGIALLEDDTEKGQLIKKADQAMYQAKNTEKGICCVFNPQLQLKFPG